MVLETVNRKWNQVIIGQRKAQQHTMGAPEEHKPVPKVHSPFAVRQIKTSAGSIPSGV